MLICYPGRCCKTLPLRQCCRCCCIHQEQTKHPGAVAHFLGGRCVQAWSLQKVAGHCLHMGNNMAVSRVLKVQCKTRDRKLSWQGVTHSAPDQEEKVEIAFPIPSFKPTASAASCLCCTCPKCKQHQQQQQSPALQHGAALFQCVPVSRVMGHTNSIHASEAQQRLLSQDIGG